MCASFIGCTPPPPFEIQNTAHVATETKIGIYHFDMKDFAESDYTKTAVES